MRKIFTLPAASFLAIFFFATQLHGQNTSQQDSLLRAYKSQPHEIAFGWMLNSFQGDYKGIPDSMDVVSLLGWPPGSTPYTQNLQQVRQTKGTRFVKYYVSADLPRLYLPSTPYIADSIPAIVQKIINEISSDSLDGCDIDYEPNTIVSDLFADTANLSRLIKGLSGSFGPKSGSAKLLIIDGQLSSFPPYLAQYVNYGVLRTYQLTAASSLETAVNQDTAIIPYSKTIITEDFRVNQDFQSGGVGYTPATGAGSILPSLYGYAAWERTKGGSKGGFGAFCFDLDALNSPSYIYMRTAIQLRNGKPFVAFSASDSSIGQGDSVHFTNMTLNAVSYRWSFPGATSQTSTAANPTVYYNDTGRYTVTLVATISTGHTDTITKVNYITVAPHYYQIQNRRNPQYYLFDNGKGTVGYSANPADTNSLYQWVEEYNAGYTRLRNRSTGNYMFVEHQTGKVECGNAPSTWWSSDWTMTAADSNWIYIENRWKPTEWIHISDLTGYAEYANPKADSSDMWQLINASPPTTLVSGGVYTLVSAVNDSSVLDVRNAGTTNGTLAQLYQSNGTNEQKWTITSVGYGYIGYYKLQPLCAPTLCLDVNNAGNANGTQVQIYSDNGTSAQQWLITAVGNGYYTLSPACATGSSLDDNLAATANGNKVQIYSSNGTNAQKWKFVFIPLPQATDTASNTALSRKAVASSLPIGADSISPVNQVYPNPTHGQLNVALYAPGSSGVSIDIIDMTGRCMQRTVTSLIKGGNNISLNISSLPPGSYILSIKGDNYMTKIFKIIKL